jgi:hypothetical protein
MQKPDSITIAFNRLCDNIISVKSKFWEYFIALSFISFNLLLFTIPNFMNSLSMTFFISTLVWKVSLTIVSSLVIYLSCVYNILIEVEAGIDGGQKHENIVVMHAIGHFLVFIVLVFMLWTETYYIEGWTVVAWLYTVQNAVLYAYFPSLSSYLLSPGICLLQCR